MKTIIIILLLFIISCENEENRSLELKKCIKSTDCSEYFECKFNIDLNENEGLCVERTKCNHSFECDNNRTCQKDYELEENFCGNKKNISFFTENLKEGFLYKTYNEKIEISYPQGEYFFELLNGNLPPGLNLEKNGTISGIPEKTGIFYFKVKVTNAPENSKIFYGVKSIEKNFKIKINENDLCNMECSEYQYCNQNGICLESKVPENLTRIYLKNNEVYQGTLIAIYDHSVWWWNNKENLYTYALFIPENFRNDLYDESIVFIESNQIDKLINSSNFLNTKTYDNFLKNKKITLKLPFKEEVFVINGNEGYHKKESGYGDFAYDFVINDSNGNNHKSSGNSNEDYYIYNKPVYSPVSGEIFEIRDGNNDNYPGEYEDESEANMIGIKIKGNYSVYMLHLKKYSIPMPQNNNCERFTGDVKCLEVGEKIKSGDYIGRVGNSGVSLIPHLHLTLFFYDKKGENGRVWSVPSLFENIKVKNIREEKTNDYYRPQTGDLLLNQ